MGQSHYARRSRYRYHPIFGLDHTTKRILHRWVLQGNKTSIWQRHSRVFGSGLLIWRIWKSLKHDESSSAARQLQIIIRILMESGVLYLSISIAHFAAYFGHDNFAVHMIGTLVKSSLSISNANYWSILQHTVVVGIAYNLVIIRVGQTRSEDNYNESDGRLTTFQVAELNQEISFGSTNSAGSGSETTEITRNKSVWMTLTPSYVYVLHRIFSIGYRSLYI